MSLTSLARDSRWRSSRPMASLQHFAAPPCSTLYRLQYDVLKWRRIQGESGFYIYQYFVKRRPGQGPLLSEVCGRWCRPAWVIAARQFWVAVHAAALGGSTCCSQGGAHSLCRSCAHSTSVQTVVWGAVKAGKKLVPANRQGVVDLDISRE